eukprot:3114773-Rhodomonas_salina.2
MHPPATPSPTSRMCSSGPQEQFVHTVSCVSLQKDEINCPTAQLEHASHTGGAVAVHPTTAYEFVHLHRPQYAHTVFSPTSDAFAL